jgi:hypothetical protein
LQYEARYVADAGRADIANVRLATNQFGEWPVCCFAAVCLPLPSDELERLAGGSYGSEVAFITRARSAR